MDCLNGNPNQSSLQGLQALEGRSRMVVRYEGIHWAMIFETEMRQFLSEKVRVRGGIAAATLTSNRIFAAKNMAIYVQKVIAQ